MFPLNDVWTDFPYVQPSCLLREAEVYDGVFAGTCMFYNSIFKNLSLKKKFS